MKLQVTLALICVLFPKALAFGAPNGKRCFTCVNNDCTGTVNCVGDEDQCISAEVTSAGVQVAVKGCASRSVCAASASNLQAAGITGNVTCCEGDLCNRGPGPALECYQYIPVLNGLYTDTQTSCSDQCGSATVLMSFGGQKTEIMAKHCATADNCVKGSINLGVLKMTINTKCCNTDLCNNQSAPALPFGAPNGKTCFTCVNNDCTGTVNCVGDEDQCISAKVTFAGFQAEVKGCASRSVCTERTWSLHQVGITGSVSCCNGNLCNRDTVPALQCYQCLPDESGTCTDTQTSCTNQCASKTHFTNYGGQEQQFSVKYCAAAAECITGSMNLGVWKTNVNSQCCSTDLCNSEIPPALSRDPNGRRCYTCVGNDCTKTLNCEGIEDRCITVHDFYGDTLVTMKGCASENACTVSRSSIWGKKAPRFSDVSCCEGDLCNRDTVQCYMCQIGSQTDTCTDYKVDCPDQCMSITHFISTDGQELQQSVKGCAAPEMCIRESINLGVWKFNNNAKCCSTDLCNSEIMPALSGTPNGRRCYTCVGNDCTIPLNCEGIEDRCITIHGTDGDTKMTMKGCVSKNVCRTKRTSIWGKKASTISGMSCCEGDMCNSAEALQCYQCIPGLNGTCTDTQKNCSDQCGSATVLMSAGGQEKERKVKDCATTEECVNGSLNLGVLKMTINTKCCNTDLCNNQTVPALPFGVPNGKTCFTCINNDCTGTVNCAGDEDQCISATVSSAGVQATVKGCASRSVCAASASSLQAAGITGNVTCCEGDLCNSATVQCYQCLPDESGTCTDTQTTCTDQCASMTHFMNYGGEEQQVSVKGCAAAEMCIRKSMNLGLWKTTLNTQCCSTDLCNSEVPPALSRVPNGRRCYTCVDNDCTKTLNCEGIEDRCITVLDFYGDTLMTMKGCVSENACTVSRSSIWGEKAPRFSDVSCCEGDLCNRDPVQCYQCLPDESGTCTDTPTFCTDQCASTTYFTNYGGQEYLYSVKDCSAECITGSINLGVWKESINTQCCNTNLCNSQTLPALSESPNGRRCYTCVDNDCTNTLNCEGIEDRCITIHDFYGGTLVTMKGCASKNACPVSRSSIWGKKAPRFSNVSCCEGDLCNRDTAPTLLCYQCKPDASGTCKTTQTFCTDHCASTTTFVRPGDEEHAISVKGCAAIEECVSGSMNLGVTKTTINTKCCSTNLCNRKTLPALSGSPNGKKCHTCVNNNCTKTLNCEGVEDRCITVNATDSGTPVTMKGCASKGVCNMNKSSIWGKKNLTIIDMKCCKGNMCNSAAGVKLSVLIMLVPLLSSFFL